MWEYSLLYKNYLKKIMEYLKFIGTYLMGFLSGYFTYLLNKQNKKFENKINKVKELQEKYQNLSSKILQQIDSGNVNLCDDSSDIKNSELFESVQSLINFSKENEAFFNKEIKDKFEEIIKIFNVFSEIAIKYYATPEAKQAQYGYAYKFYCDMRENTNKVNSFYKKAVSSYTNKQNEDEYKDKIKIQELTEKLKRILNQINNLFVKIIM